MRTPPDNQVAAFFGLRPTVSDLQAQSASGSVATFLAKGGIGVIQLATMLILARLLTPADFGVLAMVSAFFGIAGVLRDLGLATATVQRTEITPGQISTLFWFNLAGGSFMTLSGLIVAPWLAALYHDERVGVVCSMLAFSPLISALGLQHRALLERALRFRELARIVVVAVAFGNVLAVLLAYHGAAYAALVTCVLAVDVVFSLLVWQSCRWRPQRPKLDPAVQQMLSFGGYLAVFGLLCFAGNTLHNVLLGITLDATAVGLYNRAYMLTLLIQSYIADPLAVVAIVALSRLSIEPKQFRSCYLNYVNLICVLCFPLAGFGFLFAEDLILLLFGKQWAGSAPLFALMSPGLALRVLCQSTGWIYIAMGNPRGMMRWGILGWSLVILGTIIGLPLGTVGLATVQTLTIFLIFWPCMSFGFKGTALNMTALLATAWHPFCAVIITTLILAAANYELAPAPSLSRLVAGTASYGAIYLLILSEVFGRRQQIHQFARDFVNGLTHRASTAAP